MSAMLCIDHKLDDLLHWNKPIKRLEMYLVWHRHPGAQKKFPGRTLEIWASLILKIHFYFDSRARQKIREWGWESTLWTGWLKAEVECMLVFSTGLFSEHLFPIHKVLLRFSPGDIVSMKNISSCISLVNFFHVYQLTESIYPLLIHPV